MKKLLFIAAIAAFGYTNVNAQEDDSTFGFAEGDVFIEGTVGFSSANNKNTDEKESSFNISPKAGYFVTEDLAVGLDVSFQSSKEEVAGVDTADLSGFGAGVFARYYFLDLGKRFKTFSEFGVGYATAKDKSGIVEQKINVIGAGIDLGINYFVTENIALTFGLKNILSFTSGKAEVGDLKGESVSEFNFGFGDVANPFGGNAAFGLLFKL